MKTQRDNYDLLQLENGLWVVRINGEDSPEFSERVDAVRCFWRQFQEKDGERKQGIAETA